MSRKDGAYCRPPPARSRAAQQGPNRKCPSGTPSFWPKPAGRGRARSGGGGFFFFGGEERPGEGAGRGGVGGGGGGGGGGSEHPEADRWGGGAQRIASTRKKRTPKG